MPARRIFGATSFPEMSVNRQVVAIAALLMVLSAGCTTRQTIQPPAPGQPHTVLKGEVRVVHVDGRSYVLHDVRIQSDSVIGTNAAGTRIAIATAEVGTIDERRISATRTAGLVGGTVLLIGMALLIASVAALGAIY
ncbi:hypothetical protein BH23GEM1_BH23GEM1_01250 [soil metagenome]